MTPDRNSRGTRRPAHIAALAAPALALLAAALPASAAAADSLWIPDFTGTCGTILVCAGAAAEHGSALRLVPATQEQAGAAWAATPFATGASFVSIFGFRLGEGSNGLRADGLAFIMAADPTSLGQPERYGGSMGFEGVANTVAVEFDTYDNGEDGGDNHVAIAVGGALDNLAVANPFGVIGCSVAGTAGCLANGNDWTAIVAYDANAEELSVAVRDGKGTPQIVINRYGIDLTEVLGNGEMYLGFGAGTGAGAMAHDVLGWAVATGDSTMRAALADTEVPEPASALLLGAGLVALGATRRRRA